MSFFGGALSGYAGKSSDMKKQGQQGLINRFKDRKKTSQRTSDDMNILGSFRKGGRVKKTGTYKLHKGETVVPTKKRGRKAKGKAR